MVTVLNLLVFIYGSWIFLKELGSLRKKRVNSYVLMTIIFYVFQVFPLFVDMIWGDDLEYIKTLPNLFAAMQDNQVAVVYDLFALIVVSYFYQLSMRNNDAFHYYTSKFRNIQFGYFFNAILLLLIFLPIAVAIMAPNTGVYRQWAYSYRYDFSYIEELYHGEVMMPVLQVASFAVIAYYLQKKRWNFIVYMAVVIIAWLSFKRTMLVFLCIVIVGIDFLMKRYEYRKLIIKASFFLLLCVTYFVFYSSNIDKGSDQTSYESYTMYYGRQYGVKTAIYDQLNGNKMLDYRGQTILFDMFFYVPRSYWPNKPAMYSKYSTAYSKGISGYDVSTNFYVNIWAEFISNFHLWGIALAILFIQFFIKISEKSDSVIVYLLGILMVCFYLYWGIQQFTMIILVLWGVAYGISRLRKTMRRTERHPS